MQFKNWGVRIALAMLFLAGVLSCRISDTLIAQAPTATSTRTPRPTFTPIPPPTLTNTPQPTVPPTNPPPTTAPTRTPTRRPPTARPPTAKPPTAVPPPPGPTQSPYSWHVNPPGCEHAGGVFIKAKVYGDKNDPNSGMPGMNVVIGDGAGNRYGVPPVTTTYDGTYSFTLSADSAPPYKGTVYVWLVDSNGNRISDIGGPMVFNGLGPDDPATCWHGWVDFWR